MNKIAFCLLLFALCSAVNAQGFLPPLASTAAATQESHPVLIGEKVSESLTVTDDNGKRRTLLSFKSPTEVMVVTFFSALCGPEQTHWADFRRTHQRYKDWKVSFLAVNTSPQDQLPELSKALKHEKLPWPIVHDDEHAAASMLRISGTPEVLLIDEYGVLKYRGPVKGVWPALDAAIGHIDTVQDPEPPFEGKCAL